MAPPRRFRNSPSQNPALTFPQEDVTDYKGKVIFKARTEDYLDLVEAGFDLAQSAANKIGTGQTGFGTGQIDPGLASAANNQTRQRQIEALKGQRAEAIRSIKRSHPGGRVTLYMPTTLQFSDRVEYTNIDLGMVGGSAVSALRENGSVRGLLSQIMEQGVDAAGSLYDLATGGALPTEAAQVGAVRAAGALPFFGKEVQGAVSTEAGVAMNPNRRSSLQGVGIRRFQFTFKLIPTSKKEAEEITRIIEFFRLRMYPSTIGNIDAATRISAAYRFPSKFDIVMKYDTKEVATKVLPCFLESFNAVYNPSSMAFHSDGNFQETDITLSFIEERALTQEDIREGY